MKALLLVLGLLLGAGARAERTPFQVRCEDTIGKTVTVLDAEQRGYTVNNALSYGALTRMAPHDGRNPYVLGLTQTELLYSVQADGPILQDPASGYECIAPQIKVRLYYSPVTVYIGREFTSGSCAYREILAHEMRHLKSYLDHLPKVEAFVRATLAKRFGDKPLYAPHGQVRMLMQKEIDTGWMPYIEAEMALIDKQQAAIDSPEEYARLSTICQGEVQSIIGSTQHAQK